MKTLFTIGIVGLPLTIGIAGAQPGPSPSQAGELRVLKLHVPPNSVCRLNNLGASNRKDNGIRVISNSAGEATVYLAPIALTPLRKFHAVCATAAGQQEVNISVDQATISKLPPLHIQPPQRDGATSQNIGTLSKERVDVTTATAERLLELGYPPAPDKVRAPSAYQAWLRAVTNPGNTSPAETVRVPDVRHGPVRIDSGPSSSTEQAARLKRLREAKLLAAPGRTPEGTPTGATKFEVAANTCWSGFAQVSTGETFTSIMGVWNVPIPPGSPPVFPGGMASEWVGIDGYNTPDVIQAGVTQETSKGVNSFNAWFEYYPDDSFVYNELDVQPGDEIMSLVWTSTSGSVITGHFMICDFARNQGCKTKTEDEPSAQPGKPRNYSGTTVEWIMERPTVITTVEPLANYGSSIMHNAGYNDSSTGWHTYRAKTPYKQIFMNQTGKIHANNNTWLSLPSTIVGFVSGTPLPDDALYLSWLAYGLPDNSPCHGE